MRVSSGVGLNDTSAADKSRSGLLTSRHTVLLAIGPDALRQQVREFLASLGFRVIEAPTHRDATAITCRPCAPLDLLIAEGCDGIGLARQALACGNRLHVVLISSEPEVVNRALFPDPVVEFIEKPFAWCELRRKIERILPTRGDAPAR